jgi:polyhydroxyalkanoate synthesis regulator phasin
MQDAWRAYLELALGLTEASRKKAQKVAKRLVGKGGVTAVQLQALAEDLVSTSLANREALSKLVRFEVDRTLGRVGLATAEEVADLTSRVRDLEEELRQARAAGPAEPTTDGAPAAAATAPAAGVPIAKKAVAKKTVAKKTVAKKTVAKKAADAPPATATAPVKKAVARKKAAAVEPVADAVPAAEPATPAAAPAKKAVAKKAVAKKTAAPRKKAAPPAGEDS